VHRLTKIIVTVGPASDSDASLADLIAAGVDIVRLNFSHGTHESHKRTFDRIRRAADRVGRAVAVLQDLSGPKVRTGPLVAGGPITLNNGDELSIVTGDAPGDARRITTPYAPLGRSVRPGDRLLLDDGRVELRVEETDGIRIRTTVVDGGELGEHKGINAPGIVLPSDSMTAKDEEDLRFGLELGIDLVALSFVQTAEDVQRARDRIRTLTTREVPLIAKLERPEALNHLEAVLDASDGVMVARGDLGLEMPLEQVPQAQAAITAAARARGLPVIVATQVFDSMRTEPRPTRAEVSDAAHAVESGVDAIMLTGETAVGAFPVRAVQMLDAVIREAERALTTRGPHRHLTSIGPAHAHSLCEAAATLAASAQAAAIVAVTHGGTTARLLAAERPGAPILAATSRADRARSLTLYWGVAPFVTDIGEDVDTTGASISEQLVARSLVPRGSVVVLVSVNQDLARPGANYLRLLQVR
jgi:pyruvate kinase